VDDVDSYESLYETDINEVDTDGDGLSDVVGLIGVPN